MDVDPDLRAMKEAVEADLLARPGVTGVDIGYKEVGGQPTGVVAIRVLVAEKRDVPPDEAIPAEIDGHPTDVIERRFELQVLGVAEAALVPQADVGAYDPLVGGISIGPCRSPGGRVLAGTLGCTVVDVATGLPMLLSNFHVLAVDTAAAAGDATSQPSRLDGGACPGSMVGTLARWSLGGSVDGAVAFATQRGVASQIVGIGAIAGIATAVVGIAVRKRGRTTDVTYGTVDTVDLTTTLDYGDGIGSRTLSHQIGIRPDPSLSARFGGPGDSGSVVVDGASRVVGLYFAGDGASGYGIANPIAPVLSALGVTLSSTSTAPFYRYWNQAVGDHFYTASWGELNGGRSGYVLDGVQCRILPATATATGAVPFHRYWNPTVTDHFYTTDLGELGMGRFGWAYEGVAGYVYPAPAAGTIPLHRYWNATIGDHFYTTSFDELGPGGHGWIYEHIAGHVLPATAANPAAAAAKGRDAAPLAIAQAADPDRPMTFTIGT